METLWCSRNNRIGEGVRKSLALVPCEGKKCPEWRDRFDCLHLTRVDSRYGRI
jgi:hypothetical protein